MKKIMLGFILCIFFISLASAQTELTYQQNTLVDIKIVCINNGFCSSSAMCNVSIFDPDSIILLEGVSATQATSLAFYNITLNESQTSKLGEYQVAGFCKDGSVAQTVDFVFDVTPNGAKGITSGEGFTLLGIFLILILAIIFFLCFGILTTNIPFKVFFTSLSVLFLIGTMGLGFTVMEQLLGTFTSLVSGYGIFYRILIILLGGAGLGLLLYLVVTAFKSLESYRTAVESS